MRVGLASDDRRGATRTGANLLHPPALLASLAFLRGEIETDCRDDGHEAHEHEQHEIPFTHDASPSTHLGDAPCPDTDTGATERYMHAVEPELWAVAQQLEAELGALPEAHAVAQIGGVENGVNLDAAGCNQTTAKVGKSGRLRWERWPSGRRRTPAKRVWG